MSKAVSHRIHCVGTQLTAGNLKIGQVAEAEAGCPDTECEALNMFPYPDR